LGASSDDERYRKAVEIAADDITLTLDEINAQAHDRLDPLSSRCGSATSRSRVTGSAGRRRSTPARTTTAAMPPRRSTARRSTAPGSRNRSSRWRRATIRTGSTRSSRTATGPTYGAKIDNTARLDVSDVARLLPKSFLPAGSIEHPGHGTRSTREVLLAFCMRHLMQFPVPMLEKPDVLQGVTLTSRAPLETSER
jgi:hypothetical protein